MEALLTSHADSPLDFCQPQQFVDAGDCELAYWRTGDGPDLIFLHGWPLNAATYRHVVCNLANRFTCHLFDLPGAGSTKINANTQFGFRNSAQSVFNSLKRLGIFEYGLVAHDSGGAVARALADLDRNAVQGLFLAGTEIPGYHTQQIRSLINMGNHPLQFSTFSKLLKYKVIRQSRFGFGGCFHEPAKIEGEFFHLFIKPLFESKRVFHGQQKILEAMSLKEIDSLKPVHKRLEMPVQLLWGQDDPFFPARKAKEMSADFKNAQIHILDNGKLFIHEEYPDVFSRWIEKFFSRVLTT